MKKLIFILGIFVFSIAFAQDVDLNIIAQIESSGNPNAYNKSSRAVGLYQITPICLKEYNLIKGKNCFVAPFGIEGRDVFEERYITQADLYNPVINERVADWYLNIRIPQMLKAYHLPDTIDNRLWAYNAGIGTMLKGKTPRETKNYIKKYHKLEKNK